METQDKDVVSEGLGSIVVYDKWISPPVIGQRPKVRYQVLACLSNSIFVVLHFSSSKDLLFTCQHGAAVVQDKMYIYGGNHNGRYLNDLHVSKSFAQHATLVLRAMS